MPISEKIGIFLVLLLPLSHLQELIPDLGGKLEIKVRGGDIHLQFQPPDVRLPMGGSLIFGTFSDTVALKKYRFSGTGM